MEDKEKEIENLCRKAEFYIGRIKRGDIIYTFINKYSTKKEKEALGAIDLANPLIKKAISLSNNKSAEALRLQGYINYLSKIDRYVLNNYEKAFEIDPENWKLLYNMALYYFSVNEKYRDYDKASEFIMRAADKNPKSEVFWTHLSDILLKKLEISPEIIDNTIEYHLKFLELYPKNKIALRKMGEIYYMQNNFVEAIKYYKTFTERNPKNFYELELLGNAYKEVGDIENAIITYEKYVKKNPKLKEIKKILFELYSSQGYNLTNEDDVVNFIKNKEVKKKKARELRNLGLIRNRQGNAKGAIEVLEEALELDPKSTSARIYLGFSNVILGNTEKGFQMINKIIEQHPDNSDAFIFLGQAFKITGDINKSIESYKKGIALMTVKNDKYYNHRVKLALLHIANNDFEKAIELFNDTIKDYPNNPRFFNLFGTFYISQKNPQKALELFVKALKLNQLLSESYINISLTHADLGNFDAALAYLKVGLKIHPDNAQIEGALKNVYEKWGRPLDLGKFKKNL